MSSLAANLIGRLGKVTESDLEGEKYDQYFGEHIKGSSTVAENTLLISRTYPCAGTVSLRNRPTNQTSLFRSRDWLLANQGPVIPDSVGSWSLSQIYLVR
eukprot:sb/3478613/